MKFFGQIQLLRYSLFAALIGNLAFVPITHAADNAPAYVGCQFDYYKTKTTYFSQITQLNVAMSWVADKNGEEFTKFLMKEYGLPDNIRASCSYTYLNAQTRPLPEQFELNKKSSPRAGFSVVETRFTPKQF